MTPDDPERRTPLDDLVPDRSEKRKSGFGMRLRNYFFTGLIIAAPLSITVYITWTIIGWIDSWVKPWIPGRYNPDTYLPFAVPGFGLIVAVIALTFLGFATANLFGRTLVNYGELLLDRMPIVRSVYRALKQIFETVLSQSGGSFKKVGLIEYPRKGLWSIVFIATETAGELAIKADGPNTELYSVFLPTTPNPTSGYLLFVPKRDMIILEMTVEEAAKAIISAGIVLPEYKAQELAGEQPLPRMTETGKLPETAEG